MICSSVKLVLSMSVILVVVDGLGCCRFQRHPVKVESETGEWLWEQDGNSAGSSSLRP